MLHREASAYAYACLQCAVERARTIEIAVVSVRLTVTVVRLEAVTLACFQPVPLPPTASRAHGSAAPVSELRPRPGEQTSQVELFSLDTAACDEQSQTRSYSVGRCMFLARPV